MSHAREERPSEVIVVGAGVAGLSCAGLLHQRGIDVLVLEKSRGVGGRCATRRIHRAPVDHGLAFYHGDDPDFLDALRAVEPAGPFPWPLLVHGEGAPCQPRAFLHSQERLAFDAGVSSFPKHLARGLRIDLETRVTGLSLAGKQVTVGTASGRVYTAGALVLAVPAGQVPDLLATLGEADATHLGTANALLSGISMVRCLTAMAAYPTGTPVPDWEVCYPRESDILQLVSLDSAKRKTSEQPVFVFQARPHWSRTHWDETTDGWTSAVLQAGEAICGDRVSRPVWVDTHRWRYARLTGGDSLTAPLAIRLGNGGVIGVTGEAMAADGGVQAAWQAGRRMALELLGDLPG